MLDYEPIPEIRDRTMLKLVERRKIRDIVAGSDQGTYHGYAAEAGDRLPTEHSLAEQLGVSRVSAREATKGLEFLGLWIRDPGGSLWERSISAG